MNDLSCLLDRVLASADGVACVFLAIAAAVIWIRVFARARPSPPKPAGEPPVNMRVVMVSSAVVFSAMSARYFLSVLTLLQIVAPEDFPADAVRLACVSLVIGGSIAGVRAATFPVFGNVVAVLLTILSGFAGATIYLLG